MMHTKIDDRCVRFKVTHGLNGYHRQLVYAFTVDLPGMSVFFLRFVGFFQMFFFSKNLHLKNCMQKGCLKRTGALLFRKDTSEQFCSDQSAGYVTLKGGDYKGILPNMFLNQVKNW